MNGSIDFEDIPGASLTITPDGEGPQNRDGFVRIPADQDMMPR